MHDLRGMNVPELETSNGGKIAGAVLVALLIGAAATYTFSTGMWNTQTPQAVAFKYPPPARAFAPVTPVVPVVTTPAIEAPRVTPSALAVNPARTARVHIPKHEAPVTVPPADTAPAQAAPQESGPAPVVTTPPLTPPATPVTPSQPDIQP